MKLEESNLRICNQYGSRKATSSLDPLQVKTLQLDHSRITRRDYCQINHNTRACYDRILPNLPVMANKAYGLSDSIVKLPLKLLSDMVYEIKTNGGSRHVQFKNEPDNPVFGTGQGNSSSPTIWTFISNILLKSMKNQVSSQLPLLTKLTPITQEPESEVYGMYFMEQFPTINDYQKGVHKMIHNMAATQHVQCPPRHLTDGT
jgi:hypothetical protein